MPEMSKASIQVSVDADAPEISCPPLYDLRGPQVEPEVSYWLECGIVNGCPVPRPITIEELRHKLPSFDPYPTGQAALRRELEELVMLARLRDESAILGHEPAREREPQQARLPLSMFLQLRPQPLGAVINTA